MPIESLINMVKTGQWAALALLVLTLFNTWLSKDSRFPFTPPSWLRPLLVILAGQGLAVAAAAAAHQAYTLVAVHAGLASIVAITTSHAIWNGDAPPWMQWLSGVAQLLEGEVAPEAKKAPEAAAPAEGEKK